MIPQGVALVCVGVLVYLFFVRDKYKYHNNSGYSGEDMKGYTIYGNVKSCKNACDSLSIPNTHVISHIRSKFERLELSMQLLK